MEANIPTRKELCAIYLPLSKYSSFSCFFPFSPSFSPFLLLFSFVHSIRIFLLSFFYPESLFAFTFPFSSTLSPSISRSFAKSFFYFHPHISSVYHQCPVLNSPTPDSRRRSLPYLLYL